MNYYPEPEGHTIKVVLDLSSYVQATIKMLTFQLDFVSKVYLMDLLLLSLENYL